MQHKTAYMNQPTHRSILQSPPSWEVILLAVALLREFSHYYLMEWNFNSASSNLW